MKILQYIVHDHVCIHVCRIFSIGLGALMTRTTTVVSYEVNINRSSSTTGIYDISIYNENVNITNVCHA